MSYSLTPMPNRLRFFVSATRYVSDSLMFICRFIVFHLNPFWIRLSYFVFLDLLGFVALVALKPSNPEFSPRYIDMFFLSTSAITVTGLATVNMEDLSSSQIAVLTLLMFLGSEMFLSLPALVLEVSKQDKPDIADSKVSSVIVECNESRLEAAMPAISSTRTKDFKKSCLKYLGFVVLAYIVMILFIGSLLLFLYIAHVARAREVLTRKGIHIVLFSISVTVSSFTNGGLLPTNESMAVFAENPGLLMLLTGQILAGNTLFPLFLRLVIWALRRLTRAEEFKFLMKNTREIQFDHLLPNLPTTLLTTTVVALIAMTVTLFCSLDWNSPVFDGLSSYQKIVNALFMAVNARQAGENSVDCSLITPAVLVLFIVMMLVLLFSTLVELRSAHLPTIRSGTVNITRIACILVFRYLPASTAFSPIQEDDERRCAGDKNGTKKRSSSLKNLVLSPISCNAVFIISACITERRSISEDPLNFSTLNIIFEVISGYGNVGLSTGYSCSRLLQLHPESTSCKDKPYSFSGWWSDEGKLVLVFVMFYGKLKRFTTSTGQA